MNAENIVVESPQTPTVNVWIDWENVGTGPCWDLRCPVLDSINEVAGWEDENIPEGQTMDDGLEIIEQIRRQMRPEIVVEDNCTGEDLLSTHRRKFLSNLAWVNFHVGRATTMIKRLGSWEGRRWVKDV
jgi:hypothetical protein